MCGCIIYYSIWFLITISSFWFPTKFSKVDVFLNYIGISKYPYNIFTGINRLITMLFVPNLLIANPAVLIFLGKDTLNLFFYQIVFTVFLIIISRTIFRKGLKNMKVQEDKQCCSVICLTKGSDSLYFVLWSLKHQIIINYNLKNSIINL